MGSDRECFCSEGPKSWRHTRPQLLEVGSRILYRSLVLVPCSSAYVVDELNIDIAPELAIVTDSIRLILICVEVRSRPILSFPAGSVKSRKDYQTLKGLKVARNY